ncbi:unnamed protein product [Nippostrongylus brasiliensis]|uniref:Transporter n=1 Tax=Nippostrongylus brasiliensis TaxID=27835 RepID=A0A0N4YU71_NIPBR|nr:unnamed protein product [Nippostrongylus brasiliensis]
MADKSAFVPVEAVTDRKGSADNEADIDAELFGKKVSTKISLRKSAFFRVFLLTHFSAMGLGRQAADQGKDQVRTKERAECVARTWVTG